MHGEIKEGVCFLVIVYEDLLLLSENLDSKEWAA